MPSPAFPGPNELPDDESGPHVSGPLSRSERRALTRIEADLTHSDPFFARRMRPGRTEPLRWVVRGAVLLAVGVAAFAVALLLVPTSWLVLFGLVLTLLVMPCLLMCATERRDRR